jgi:hypothetical protein
MKISERFALNEWLTEYPENLTFEEIIGLMIGDEDEWTHDQISVWQTVENFTLRQVAEFICDTQTHFANVTDEMP